MHASRRRSGSFTEQIPLLCHRPLRAFFGNYPPGASVVCYVYLETLAVIVLCGYIGLWTFWFQELRQLIWTKLWQRKIWVQLSFNGQMNVIELLLWVTVLISQPMVSGHYWPFLCSGHVRIGSGCVHVTAKWDLVKQLLASDGSCHSHWPIHPSEYALTYIQR